jgi:AcrR family transcriptional regulator
MARTAVGAAAPERLGAEARREALLDVARELVVEDGPEGVTMGTVAERADVTRALVYKHFANRDDILAALFRREATALYRALRRTVAAAPEGFELKLRAFVHAVLDVLGTHDHVFAPLQAFGRDPAYQREQRSWDRKTVRFFSALAVEDLGLDKAVARAALAILLSGIDSLLAQARASRSARHRDFLEDLFVDMTMASLARLAARPPGRAPEASSRSRSERPHWNTLPPP